MERLLADAEKLSGIKYDVSSFSDIVDAIHVIQTEMGITGTTALEAEKTISGSLAALRASFSNLTVGLGDANADVEMLCQHVIDAFGTLVDNVEPIAENIAAVLPEALSAGIDAIEQLLPELLSSVGDLIADATPELADAAVALVGSLASGLLSNLDQISAAALEVTRTLVDVLLQDALPALPGIAGQIIYELGSGLASHAPELMNSAAECIRSLVDGLIAQLPVLLDVALQLTEGLSIGLLSGLEALLSGDNLASIIDGLCAFLVNGIPQLVTTLTTIVEQLVTYLPSIIEGLLSPQIIESLVAGLLNSAGALIAGAVQLVAVLVANLPEITFALLEAIPDIVQGLIDGIVSGFASGHPEITDAIFSLGNALVEAFCEFFGIHSPSTLMKEQAGFLVQGVVEALTSMPEEMAEILARAVVEIVRWGVDIAAKATNAARNFVTNVSSAVSQLPGKVWTWLQNTITNVLSFSTNFAQKAKLAGENFLTNITDKVKEIPGRMLSIGKDIVSGVWNGISSASSWLYNKVTSFAKGIITGIKNALGIHSPSRIMKEAVGAMLPPGISEGFADALPAAEKSMEQQLGTMTEKLSGVSIPAMVSASMDTGALEMMRAAVDLKTGQTAASVLGEDPLDLPQKIGMLFERFDALMARMEALENDRLVSLSDLREALKGLRVEMDGRDVGEIIDERLGELYDMRENGVI